jgi:hypothetical protein
MSFFLSGLITRVTTSADPHYVPFEEREGQRLVMTLLCPRTELDDMEDTANNIEAVYLADELVRNADDVRADLVKLANRSEYVARLVLFAGQQFMASRGDSSLFKVAVSARVKPDVVVAFAMARRLAAMGLKGDIPKLMLELMVEWSKVDRTVFLYLLSVLAKMSRGRAEEAQLVAQWLEKVEEECCDNVSDIEDVMITGIRAALLPRKD